jgi:hypothetical protein
MTLSSGWASGWDIRSRRRDRKGTEFHGRYFVRVASVESAVKKIASRDHRSQVWAYGEVSEEALEKYGVDLGKVLVLEDGNDPQTP